MTNDEEGTNGTPAGRHNIRPIIPDDNLTKSTKEASMEESERRRRMEERQERFSGRCVVKDPRTGKVVRLCLDFDDETEEPIVEVHPQLCHYLKDHQAYGIKFLWDAVFESKAELLSGLVNNSIRFSLPVYNQSVR